MKKRTHFYVSVKNVMTWLIALLMVCSVVARILFVDAKGADTWSQIVLPNVAAVLFVCILLLWGKEQFFKTALSVWMYCIYFAILFFKFDFQNFDTLIGVVFALALMFVAVVYTRVTSGRIPATSLLTPVMLLPLVGWLCLNRQALAMDYDALKPFLADGFMTLGLIMLPLALRIHPADEYHPTWGDRPDGRKLRSLDPMTQVGTYIMVDRSGCSNGIEDKIEITNLERFIRAKRKEGMTNLGVMHVMLAGYCRAVAKYPGVNRFISGQKFYTHGEDIQFCMTVKKEMSVDSPETIIKLHLTPRDTLEDVYKKFNDAIEEVKNTPLDSTFDSVAHLFSLIPGVFLKFVVWLLRVLDYFGLLPKFLLEVSPFHGSVYFTSMGSLGIPPVQHHLYDFGNMPLFVAFGSKRRVLENMEDGTVVQRKYIDVKVTCDDRVVDGFYYAAFLKQFKRLMIHPEVLLEKPEEVVQDVD